MAQLRQDYPQFQARHAEILAITTTMEVRNHDYFRVYRLPFPLLLDPRRRVFNRYGVQWRLLSLGQRPGVFVVDREGIVQFAHVGRQQWEIPRNETVLAVLDRLAG